MNGNKLRFAKKLPYAHKVEHAYRSPVINNTDLQGEVVLKVGKQHTLPLK